MKKNILLTWIIALVFILAACSEDTSSNDDGTKSTSKKVTVYSPHETTLINPIIKEFQEVTGITVELVTGGSGELLNRIKAESGKPLGDVLWGGGAESLEAFKENFEPFEVSESENILDVYKSSDNSWTGFSALPMVIMYNKDMVKETDVPDSWESLLDAKWKGKIAYADPAKSGSSFTQLVTILKAKGDAGEEGWSFVKKLQKNMDGKVLSSSSMAPKGVADGEFPIGLTHEQGAYQYISGGANVGVSYPTEGTSAVPDGMAIIKGAKNVDNAQKLLNFLAGKDVQDMLVKEFNRRSVRTDVEPPEGLIKTTDIKLVDYDLEWASSNQTDILGKFQDILIGK